MKAKRFLSGLVLSSLIISCVPMQAGLSDYLPGFFRNFASRGKQKLTSIMAQNRLERAFQSFRSGTSLTDWLVIAAIVGAFGYLINDKIEKEDNIGLLGVTISGASLLAATLVSTLKDKHGNDCNIATLKDQGEKDLANAVESGFGKVGTILTALTTRLNEVKNVFSTDDNSNNNNNNNASNTADQQEKCRQEREAKYQTEKKKQQEQSDAQLAQQMQDKENQNKQ